MWGGGCRQIVSELGQGKFEFSPVPVYVPLVTIKQYTIGPKKLRRAPGDAQCAFGVGSTPSG